MHTVNMHEAKTKLSSLVEEAVAGEEVIIAKAGKSVVKLVPVRKTAIRRTPGRLKGQICMSKDFGRTSEDMIRDFEGDVR